MGVKAFELISAIENVIGRTGERDGSAHNLISCIECYQDALLIGTSHGFVMRYSVDARTSSEGRVEFNSYRQKQIQLPMRKPVEKMAASPSLNIALVLWDATLMAVGLSGLEVTPSHAKLKNVTSFCVNESEKTNPLAVEVCVIPAKKKCLQLYNITEDKCILRKEISVSEVPTEVRMDGRILCASLQSKYIVVDYEAGTTTDLFPFDCAENQPIIRKVSKTEFLLSGPGGLGMFITGEATSQRPPLSWRDEGSSLRDVAYLHPYIVSLDDQFLSVHSFLDQQQKQVIKFTNGCLLQTFKGRLLIASHREIFALAPVPWEKQVKGLLDEEKVDEALAITHDVIQSTEGRPPKVYSQILQRAGFIRFARCEFAESEEHFLQGNLDPRELLSLYSDDLLPDGSTFARTSPPLHPYASLRQMASGVPEKERLYEKSVVNYLESVLKSSGTGDQREVVALALLKLYAQTDSPKLSRHVDVTTTILSQGGGDVTAHGVNPADRPTMAQQCATTLEKYGRHHCLATLHVRFGQFRQAIDIWSRIACGKLTDSKFPGLDFLVAEMKRVPVHEYMWEYLPIVLDLDQEKAVQILTQRRALSGVAVKGDGRARRGPEGVHQFADPEYVVDKLSSKYPLALRVYLEYLIREKHSDSEHVHTYLARLYQEEVMRLTSAPEGSPGDGNALAEARKKLQDFLRQSKHYQVRLLLGKMEQQDCLFEEKAILYGKLEQHERALSILVHEVKDYRSAEEYCVQMAEGRPESYRRQLFGTLLEVYLDPQDREKDKLMGPALDLLNSPSASFNCPKIIESIPKNWLVSTLRRFLLQSARSSLHQSRMHNVARSLAHAENVAIKRALLEKKKKIIAIGEDRVCDICQRGFTEVNFLHLPSGVVAHALCAKSTYALSPQP